MRTLGLKAAGITVAAAVAAAVMASGGVAMATTSAAPAARGAMSAQGTTDTAAGGVTAYVPWGTAPVTISDVTWTLVLETPVVTTAGTYYVSGSVSVWIASGTTTVCTVGGSTNDLSWLGNNGSTGMYDSLAVTGTTSVAAGDTIKIVCAEEIGTATQQFTNGNIDAVLVGGSVGTVGGGSYGPSTGASASARGASSAASGASSSARSAALPKVKLTGQRAG